MTTSRSPSTSSYFEIVQRLVAHRGANNDAPGNTLQQLPENTLPALQEAYQKGFMYVECDVHRTQDGKIVVLHDETLERTARYNPNMTTTLTHKHFLKIRDKDISTLSYEEEVSQVDVGAYAPRLGEAFHGTPIPLLMDFLKKLEGSSNRRLVIEVKPGHHEIIDDLVNLVEGAVKDLHLDTDQLVFISFDYMLIAALKAKQPEYRHMLLTVSHIDKDDPDYAVYRVINNEVDLTYCLKLAEDAELDGINLEYDAQFIDANIVKRIHAENLMVAVWTYMQDDTLNMVKSMLAAGVDLVNTNQPESIMAGLAPKDDGSSRFKL